MSKLDALVERMAALVGISPDYTDAFGRSVQTSPATRQALLGGVGQIALQWPALRREGFRYRPVIDFADPDLRQVGRVPASESSQGKLEARGRVRSGRRRG